MSAENKRPEDPNALRAMVSENYGRIAREAGSCCGPSADCDVTLGALGKSRAAQASKGIGYREEDLAHVPEEANLGLGCGNPTALASLEEGEVVLDLGSGAGLDAFLAAGKVGPKGRVIGVDMTEDMIQRARRGAESRHVENVEFRLGTIESLPVESDSVDVIISNCVVNLSPEKDRVFREAFRVLKPGGRLMISDIVLEKPLPPEISASIDAYLGCVGNASMRTAYLGLMREAGFEAVNVERESNFGHLALVDEAMVQEAAEKYGYSTEDVRRVARTVTSITVSAYKPARGAV